MNAATLGNIVDRMLALHNLVESGEMTAADVADTLESIEGELEVKAANIVSLSAEWLAEADVIDVEIARLTKRKQARKNAADHLREWLLTQMLRAERKEIKTPLFSVIRPKPTKIVEIENVDALPDEFVKAETTITPRKKEIAAALKAGDLVPGAKLVDGRDYLKIS